MKRDHGIALKGHVLILVLAALVANALPIAITGSVNRSNGTPVKGATVWLANQKCTATTDDNGAFVLSGQTTSLLSGSGIPAVNRSSELKNNTLFFDVRSSFTDVCADVFSISGRHISSLSFPRVVQGSYRLAADAADLSSGLYCVRLKVGSAVSFFRMTCVPHRNNRTAQLTKTSSGIGPGSPLAKKDAVVDSLIVGCADCRMSSKSVETYSGTYSFVMENASYTPPAYIQNSSCQWVYNVALTDTENYVDVSGVKGHTYVSLKNFLWLGDSIRYTVERIDSSVVTSAQTGQSVTKIGHASQTYTDPVNCSPLTFWNHYSLFVPPMNSDKLRATYNGTPISIVKAIGYDQQTFTHIYSDELGQISFFDTASVMFNGQTFMTGYCPLFTLTRLNQNVFDTSKIVYLPNPVSFRKAKDTTGAFIGFEMIFTISNIYNPDNASVIFTLLTKPSGMTMQTDTTFRAAYLHWTPAAQNTGANEVRVHLADPRGYSDTLDLFIYGIVPSTTFTDSSFDYSPGVMGPHNVTTLSKVMIGAIDSSISSPKYCIAVKDTSWAFLPIYPTPSHSDSTFIFSCSRDSALASFWSSRYPALLEPGIVYKAFFDPDSITIKTVLDSSDSSSPYCSNLYRRTSAVYSRQIGLISYDFQGSSTCMPAGPDNPSTTNWGTSKVMVQYNGKQFSVSQIKGFK